MRRLDFFLALLLATLMYSDIWIELLAPAHELDRSFRQTPGPSDFAAVILNVLLTSALFLAVVTLGRRFAGKSGMRVVRWVSLVSLVLPWDLINVRYRGKLSIEERILRFSSVQRLELVIGLALAVFLVVRFEKPVVWAAKSTLLILFPLVPFTFGKAAWRVLTKEPSRAVAARPSAPTNRCVNPQRVIWLVFDGMDGGDAAFGDSAKIRLPHLDRFEQEAIYAPRAFAPGTETRISMPSYILGKKISKLIRNGRDQLLYLVNGQNGSYSWADQPTIFSKAKQNGINTALIGWHIPYCSVMGRSLDFCFTQIWDTAIPSGEPGILGRALHQTARRVPFYMNREHIDRARNALQKAIEVGTDTRYGFVMIHWSVPHFPPIYDRNSHRYSSFRRALAEDAYLDNAILADDLFGEFEAALHRANQWDPAIIIVTADHPAALPPRPDISRISIPFFIKMPGQKHGSVLDFPIGTLLIHDLSLAMMCGELRTPSQATQWMKLHS